LKSDLSGWEEVSSPLLGAPRYALASSVIDDKWLLSGGDSEESIFKSTLVFDEDEFSVGPEMPMFKDYHCQITIDPTFIIFLGGGERDTFVLNWETKEFAYLNNIPLTMSHSACGLIYNENYGWQVLLATEEDSYVFSFMDLKWDNGPILPSFVRYSATAMTRNGLLSIGGVSKNGIPLTTVYRFDELYRDWILEEATLKTGRTHAAALAVPDDFVTCTV